MDETSPPPNSPVEKMKRHVFSARKPALPSDDYVDSIRVDDDPNTPSVIVLAIGQSMSGKSHLVQNIIKRKILQGQFKAGIVFSKTKFNGGYDWMGNQNLVIQGYDANMFKRYLRKLENYRKSHNNRPLCNYVVFDDLGMSIDWNDPFISSFIAGPRHWGCSVFICVQYAKGLIYPIVREQSTNVFLFQQFTDDSMIATYKAFGSKLGDYKKFISELNQITSQPYHCLTVTKTPGSGQVKYGEYCSPAKKLNIAVKFGAKKQEEKNEENEIDENEDEII